MLTYNDPRRKKLRKELRAWQTKAEALLWWYLRDRRFHGLKFRRQYGIGRYVVDFYCAKLRLVIEVDGDTHSSPEERTYDAEREMFIAAHDMRIIRFTNPQVLHDLEHVLEEIEGCIVLPPLSPPAPGGELSTPTS